VRAPRRWLIRYLAEVVVLVLLAVAFVTYRFDLGDQLFGHEVADPATQPAAVLPPVGLRLPTTAPVPALSRPPAEVRADPGRVAAAVRPLLRPRVLGRHVGVLVTDLATGRPVYRSGAPVVTPASTTKLVTATAALEVLGPMARFRTSARWVARTHTLVLVGGGDPFLASSPRLDRVSYPVRADVVTLARAAARRLHALHVKRVRVAYDDSYFTGPSVNPAWPDTYVPEDVVAPIGSLWVDEGRSPTGFGFVEDPAAVAGRTFADAVRAAGVKVAPEVARAAARTGAVDVASVSSAPLGEIVERTLAVSDNQAAEVLARHVGLAEKQEGSFQAGSTAVLDVVRRLGVATAGDRLYDGSGLSREDRLSTSTLAGVLRLATSRDHPQLRAVLTGLPVAGFTGSLQNRFAQGPAEARGRVRAKTGTLTGVHGLAGVAEDPSGARMVFVVVADRVALPKNLQAQTMIDRLAGALGACTCGVGSAS
jgi:D-alanyl-D-alanine carboxypeptidase/D-alanyl-D-alanine-endopeptidase (penicillin-binding protein 4)